MSCIYQRLDKAALKALDNYEASIQKNEDGKNMGMLAAENYLEKVVLKALDNKMARTQKDYFGKNILFMSKMYNLGYAIEKGQMLAELDKEHPELFDNDYVNDVNEIINAKMERENTSDKDFVSKN